MPAWLSSGFSPIGLLAVVLQQLPGIVWALHPPEVDPFAHNSGSLPVEMLEKTFGIATVVLLVVVLARVPIPSVVRTVSLVGVFAILASSNYPAILTSVIFGGVHVGLTYANLGPAATKDVGQATRPS